MRKFNHGRFKIGFLFLYFIIQLTASCSSEVSRNKVSRRVENENGFIKLTGNDNGNEYECTGIDTNFDSNNTSIYSCSGSELVINR